MLEQDLNFMTTKEEKKLTQERNVADIVSDAEARDLRCM